MIPTRVFKLTRVRVREEAGGYTLFFQTPGMGRRCRPIFFQPENVPEFEGDVAWFLAERPPKCRWQVVRRVNSDGSPYLEGPPIDA